MISTAPSNLDARFDGADRVAIFKSVDGHPINGRPSELTV